MAQKAGLFSSGPMAQLLYPAQALFLPMVWDIGVVLWQQVLMWLLVGKVMTVQALVLPDRTATGEVLALLPALPAPEVGVVVVLIVLLLEVEVDMEVEVEVEVEVMVLLVVPAVPAVLLGIVLGVEGAEGRVVGVL